MTVTSERTALHRALAVPRAGLHLADDGRPEPSRRADADHKGAGGPQGGYQSGGNR